VTLGAKTVFVLQVGRIERPLRPPRRPWEVAQVAFEVARRHRFARELAEAPPSVAVHVLPTGGSVVRSSYRSLGEARARISRAYEASRGYLDGL
jgi:NTE family protein